MKRKENTRLLLGINVLLKYRVPLALNSIDFFKMHENKYPVEALIHLREGFYHLSKTAITENLNEKFNYLNMAFDYVEKAALEPWKLQFNRKMKRILVRRNVMKYLGLVLGLRRISLKEISECLAMADEYKVNTEKNHKRLKDRVNDYKKACQLLHNLEEKIPAKSDYLERIFEVILMLLGILIGVMIEKYLLR